MRNVSAIGHDKHLKHDISIDNSTKSGDCEISGTKASLGSNDVLITNSVNGTAKDYPRAFKKNTPARPIRRRNAFDVTLRRNKPVKPFRTKDRSNREVRSDKSDKFNINKAIERALDEVLPDLKTTDPEIYNYTKETISYLITKTRKISKIEIKENGKAPKEQLFDTLVNNLVAQYLVKLKGKKYQNEEFQEKAQEVIEKVLDYLQQKWGHFFGDDQKKMILYVLSKVNDMMEKNDDGTISVDNEVVDNILNGPGFGGENQIDVETLKEALKGKVSAKELEEILQGKKSIDEINEIIINALSFKDVKGMVDKFFDALSIDIKLWAMSGEYTPKLEIFEELGVLEEKAELFEYDLKEDIIKKEQEIRIDKQEIQKKEQRCTERAW